MCKATYCDTIGLHTNERVIQLHKISCKARVLALTVCSTLVSASDGRGVHMQQPFTYVYTQLGSWRCGFVLQLRRKMRRERKIVACVPTLAGPSYLQRGTAQFALLQHLECRLRRTHIFLHIRQPPETEGTHSLACNMSAFTLRQLLLTHCVLWHWHACMSRAIVRCSCSCRSRRSASVRRI